MKDLKRYLINAVIDICVGVSISVAVIGTLLFSLKIEKKLRGKLA